MCGRTACTLAPEVICNACGYYDSTSGRIRKPIWREHPATGGAGAAGTDSAESTNMYRYRSSANLTPTMYSPVMMAAGRVGNEVETVDRVIQPMMWGMIPPWHKKDAKSHGLSTNNARLEGLLESKLYKRPLSQRKLCVILAQGFYEWKTVDAKPKTTKQPYFIYMPQVDKELKIYDAETWEQSNWNDETGWSGPRILMMAGLYDTWKSENGEVIYSYTVITMESNSALSWLHERMPAILETPEQVQAWLCVPEGTPISEMLAILKPVSKFQYYPVSTKVNNSRCRDLDCMNPMVEEKSKEKSFMEKWLAKPGGGSGKTPRNNDDNESETGSNKKPKIEKYEDDKDKKSIPN